MKIILIVQIPEVIIWLRTILTDLSDILSVENAGNIQ